jgi:hypothetical protein
VRHLAANARFHFATKAFQAAEKFEIGSRDAARELDRERVDAPSVAEIAFTNEGERASHARNTVTSDVGGERA